MGNELDFFAAFLAFITICCGIFHAYTFKGTSLSIFTLMHDPISFRDLFHLMQFQK
ncbi:RAxF-45 family protein [Jeotgalibacillus marinus]|uniref:RAxF-45 family protein n=1 Tax=Jeotgalibacillus marinus TaxID=86667 RepID=A0ABV3Q093_9BACL